MEKDEIEQMRQLLASFLRRRGHGSLKDFAKATGVHYTTVKRFLESKNIEANTFMAFKKKLQEEGFLEAPIVAPGTENPLAFHDPVKRLAVALNNASLMLDDPGPLSDRMAALDNVLRYMTDSLIPEILKKAGENR